MRGFGLSGGDVKVSPRSVWKRLTMSWKHPRISFRDGKLKTGFKKKLETTRSV